MGVFKGAGYVFSLQLITSMENTLKSEENMVCLCEICVTVCFHLVVVPFHTATIQFYRTYWSRGLETATISSFKALLYICISFLVSVDAWESTASGTTAQTVISVRTAA